ncbi:MAG: hypothetical protein H6739_38295 [Alphaproteobacteria bacterium]|nr:hypothetical protein [Alphaproteobacteria bacterium]
MSLRRSVPPLSALLLCAACQRVTSVQAAPQVVADIHVVAPPSACLLDMGWEAAADTCPALVAGMKPMVDETRPDGLLSVHPPPEGSLSGVLRSADGDVAGSCGLTMGMTPEELNWSIHVDAFGYRGAVWCDLSACRSPVVDLGTVSDLEGAQGWVTYHAGLSKVAMQRFEDPASAPVPDLHEYKRPCPDAPTGTAVRNTYW